MKGIFAGCLEFSTKRQEFFVFRLEPLRITSSIFKIFVCDYRAQQGEICLNSCDGRVFEGSFCFANGIGPGACCDDDFGDYAVKV